MEEAFVRVPNFNLLEPEARNFFNKRLKNQSLSWNRRLDIASVILGMPDYLIRSNASLKEKISHIDQAKRRTLLHYHPDKGDNVIKAFQLIQNAAELLLKFIFSQLPERSIHDLPSQYQYVLMPSFEPRDCLSIASQTSVRIKQYWRDFNRTDAVTAFQACEEKSDVTSTVGGVEKKVEGDIAFCLLVKAGALPGSLTGDDLKQILEQAGNKKLFFQEPACLMLMHTCDWFKYGIPVAGNNNKDIFQHCYQQFPEIISKSRLEEILEEGYLSEADVIKVITHHPNNLRYISMDTFMWLVQKFPPIFHEVLRSAVLMRHLRESYFIQDSIFDPVLNRYEGLSKRIIKQLLLGNRIILAHSEGPQLSQVVSNINMIPEHVAALAWILAAIEHNREFGMSHNRFTLPKSVRSFFCEEELLYICPGKRHKKSKVLRPRLVKSYESSEILQYCYQQFPDIIFESRLHKTLKKGYVSEAEMIEIITRTPDNLRRIPIYTFRWLIQKFSPVLNIVLSSSVLMKYLRENSFFILQSVFDRVLIPYKGPMREIIRQLLLGNREILSLLNDECLLHISYLIENVSKHTDALFWLVRAVEREWRQRRIGQKTLGLSSYRSIKDFFCELEIFYGVSIREHHNKKDVFQQCYQQFPEILSQSCLEEILEEQYISEQEMMTVITSTPDNLRRVPVDTVKWLIQEFLPVRDTVLNSPMLMKHLRESHYFMSLFSFERMLTPYKHPTEIMIKQLLLGNRTVLSSLNDRQLSHIAFVAEHVIGHANTLFWLLEVLEHQCWDKDDQSMLRLEEFLYDEKHVSGESAQPFVRPFTQLIFDRVLGRNDVFETEVMEFIAHTPDHFKQALIVIFIWLIQRNPFVLSAVLSTPLFMRYLRENSYFMRLPALERVLMPYRSPTEQKIKQFLSGNRDSLLPHQTTVVEKSYDVRAFFWEETSPPSKWRFESEIDIKRKIVGGDFEWARVLSFDMLNKLHWTNYVGIARELWKNGHHLFAGKYLEVVCQHLGIFFNKERTGELLDSIDQEYTQEIEEEKSKYKSNQLDELECEFIRMLDDPEMDETSLRRQLEEMFYVLCKDRTSWFVETVRFKLEMEVIPEGMYYDEKTDELTERKKRILSYIPETDKTAFIKERYRAFFEKTYSVSPNQGVDIFQRVRNIRNNRERDFNLLPIKFAHLFFNRAIIEVKRKERFFSRIFPMIQREISFPFSDSKEIDRTQRPWGETNYRNVVGKILKGQVIDKRFAEELGVNAQSYEILNALERVFDLHYVAKNDVKSFYEDMKKYSTPSEQNESLSDSSASLETFNQELIRQWIRGYLKRQIDVATRLGRLEAINQVVAIYYRLDSQDREHAGNLLKESYQAWFKGNYHDAIERYYKIREYIKEPQIFPELERLAVAYKIQRQIGFLFSDPFIFSKVQSRTRRFFRKNRKHWIDNKNKCNEFNVLETSDETIKKIYQMFRFFCDVLCPLTKAEFHDAWAELLRKAPILSTYFPLTFKTNWENLKVRPFDINWMGVDIPERAKYLNAMSSYYEEQSALPPQHRQPLLIREESYSSIIARQAFKEKYPQCVSLIQREAPLKTLCAMLRKYYLGEFDVEFLRGTASVLSARFSVWGSRLSDKRIGKKNILEVRAFIAEHEEEKDESEEYSLVQAFQHFRNEIPNLNREGSLYGILDYLAHTFDCHEQFEATFSEDRQVVVSLHR